MKIEISIIVPVYNKEKFLSYCLRSIEQQTFNDFELVLVDDGSTDKSLSICNNFANKYNWVKVISQKNKGVSAARNTGLKHAVGKYLAFIDADDSIEPSYLAQLYSSIVQKKSDMVTCGLRVKSYDNKANIERCPIKSDITIDNILRNFNIYESNFLSCCCKLFKKQIILNNNIIFDTNLSNGEDGLFVLTYLKYCKFLSFIDQILYNYTRFDADTLSSSSNFAIGEISFKNADATTELFKTHNIERQNIDRNIAVFKTIVFYFNRVFDHRLSLSKKEKMQKINKLVSNCYINKMIDKYPAFDQKSKLIYFFIKHKLSLMLFLVFKYKFKNGG